MKTILIMINSDSDAWNACKRSTFVRSGGSVCLWREIADFVSWLPLVMKLWYNDKNKSKKILKTQAKSFSMVHERRILLKFTSS